MKVYPRGDSGLKDKLNYHALRLACCVGASMLLIPSEKAWALCAGVPGTLVLAGATCSESGVSRTHNDIGDAKPVVSVSGGGSYTGTDVTLENGSGNSGHGLSVRDAGSIARLYESSIISTGTEYGYGVDVTAGGAFEAENLEISTSGDSSDAIAISDPNSTANLTGAKFETSGDHAEGIQAGSGSRFFGSNVVINTLATGDNAESNAVFLNNGANGELVNAILTTRGGLSSGVWAFGSTFTGAQIAIETFGVLSDGVLVPMGLQFA